MVQTGMTVRNMDGLRAALDQVPKDLQRDVRAELRPLGLKVRDDAARRASWSSRIPRSLSLRIRFGNRPSVTILARRTVAPHARALEGAPGKPAFRHPVFGNREAWVAQRTRPFLLPAMRANGGYIRRQMARTVREVLARNGLKPS